MEDGAVRQRKDDAILQRGTQLGLRHLIDLGILLIRLRRAEQPGIRVNPVAIQDVLGPFHLHKDTVRLVFLLIAGRANLFCIQLQHILIGGNPLGQISGVIPGVHLLPGAVPGIPKAELSLPHQPVLGASPCGDGRTNIPSVRPNFHRVGGASSRPEQTDGQLAIITLRAGETDDDTLHRIRPNLHRQEVSPLRAHSLLIDIGEYHLRRTSCQRRQAEAHKDRGKHSHRNGEDQNGPVLLVHGTQPTPFPDCSRRWPIIRRRIPPAAGPAAPASTGWHPQSAGRPDRLHRD